MPKYDQHAFNNACAELTEFVLIKAIDTALERPFVGWYASPTAPTTFEELKAEYDDALFGCGGAIQVSDQYCENTVYGTPESNHAFRFWHDLTHVLNDLNFTAADEFQVALLHQYEAMLGGLSSLARLILWADTQGQSEFLAATGEYPSNQMVFAQRYVAAHLADLQPIGECISAHVQDLADAWASRLAHLQAFELDLL